MPQTPVAVSDRPSQLELRSLHDHVGLPAQRWGDRVERLVQLLGLTLGAAAGPGLFLPHLYPHLREGSWALLMVLPGLTVALVFGLGWAAGRGVETALYARGLSRAGVRRKSLPAPFHRPQGA